MASILASTKELLGISEDVTDFDSQLVIYINMALATLSEIISGPEDPYQITSTDGGDLDEFLPNDKAAQSMVQMYIFSKVRLQFDPPTSAAVLTALQATIAEYEWRLNDYELETTS